MSLFTTLNGRKWAANRQIDEAAGNARQRYITDVPGQQFVYMTKMQEAREYLQAFANAPAAATPGPHIAALVERSGRTARLVAQEVVRAASVWANNKSPAIEAARMAGKEAIEAATADTIDAVLTAAVAELTAL